MIRDLADVFDVLQLIVRSDYKHRARVDAIKRPALDQHSVVLSERPVTMIAGRRDIFHARSATPSLHSKRKVHAYAGDLHARQFRSFLVESFCFGVAY